jgi:hypothetical protein
MIFENGHLQRLLQTVTKWFAPAPLHVVSYDMELKMEIKLWEFRNISRRLCEEVVAPKSAKAHTLGTTGLDNVTGLNIHPLSLIHSKLAKEQKKNEKLHGES